MSRSDRSFALRVAATVLAGVLSSAAAAQAQLVLKPLTPAQRAPAPILVARIDADCAVFQTAIRTERPTEIAAVGTTSFTALDAARRAQVEAMTDHVWIVHAWRVAGNLNWVSSSRLDAQGSAHLTQLCFRNDGTLARVRQAAADAEFDTGAAREAYFRTDGSLIRASALFERNDPAVPSRAHPAPYDRSTP